MQSRSRCSALRSHRPMNFAVRLGMHLEPRTCGGRSEPCLGAGMVVRRGRVGAVSTPGADQALPQTGPQDGVSCYTVSPPAPAAALGRRSGFPATVLERLVRITPGLDLFLPELEELALLPAPPRFRRPFAHHVLVLARLDHLTGD